MLKLRSDTNLIVKSVVKIIKKFRINHIRIRITLYFSILVFFIIIAISYAISSIFSQEVINQTSGAVQQKMSVITGVLDSDIDTIKSTYSKLVNNQSIQNLLLLDPKSEQQIFERNSKLNDIISQYYGENYLINKIIAVDRHSNVLDPLYSSPLYSKAIIANSNFKKVIENNLFSRFSEPTVFPFNTTTSEEKDKLIITYYVQYLSNKDYQPIGYMLINFNKLILFNKIANNCVDVFDTTFIVNKDGRLIYKIGNLDYTSDMFGKVPQLESFNNKIFTMNNSKYLIFTKQLSSNTDWSVVGLVSYNSLTQKVGYMNLIVYIIGLFCILLVIFISYNIAKRITDPIFTVNKAMKKIENGEWPEIPIVKSDVEIKYLINGFNTMVANIRNLIDTIYTEQEDKKKAEVTALKFQLESLQSQINPHFMYNTLNAISYLAMKRGADDIREMIQSFNMLLSASMSANKEFITIDEEIQCILSYLKLQRCRYDFEFKFIYNIPEDLLQCKIPRLILQPLVENSLFHGIALKDFEGTIRVIFEKQGDRIKVSTIDDGVGIPKSELPLIINKNTTRSKSSFNNIGLANVDERLKLYFGEEYRLKIFSNTGIGTCVEFFIQDIN